MSDVKKAEAAQHTPGPWDVSDWQPEALEVVAYWSEKVKSATASGYGDYRGIIICNLPHQGDNPCVSKTQADANARLIAAAPELLEALEDLLIHTKWPATRNDQPNVWDRLERAEAAIRKAKGEL